MGVWINPLPAAQPSDMWDTCTKDVYELMQSTCFRSQGGPFNVAAVNLQTLPDMGTNGSQVDSGYPSEFSFLLLFFVLLFLCFGILACPIHTAVVFDCRASLKGLRRIPGLLLRSFHLLFKETF